MVGGAGHDDFLEDAVANGGDVMEGGEFDRVLYTQRTRPVRVELDAQADDGERGEHDRVGRAIEAVLGGAGADTLIGNELSNTLDGGPGADRLFGRAGNDRLAGGSLFARHRYDERIHGGPGRDELRSGDGDDRLSGGRGHDVLRSGNGQDLLIPGAGIDRAFGGPANDVIRARDGEVDEIDCGRGWDRLRNDPLDWQPLPRCERHDGAEVIGGSAS
jgi:Ca2+-binding RTX toxin-like protein